MRAICFSFTLLGLLFNALFGIDAGLFPSAHDRGGKGAFLSARHADSFDAASFQDSEKVSLRAAKRPCERNRNGDSMAGGPFESFRCPRPPSFGARVCTVPMLSGYKMPFSDLEHSMVPLLI